MHRIFTPTLSIIKEHNHTEQLPTKIDGGVKKSVPAKHDIIALFKIENDYFVLGIPIANPISDHPLELKTSIRGLNRANYSVPIMINFLSILQKSLVSSY